MSKQYLILLCVALATAQEAPKPVYKYRYETEDVMKTAASSIPVHGYHVVEGGYYPQVGLGGAGLGGAGLGGAGLGGAGLGGAGLGGAGLGIGAGGAGLGGIGVGGGQQLLHHYGGLGGAGLGLGLGGGQFIGGGGGQFIGGGAPFIGGGGGGGGFVGGAPYLHHGYGGEVIDKNVYSGGKKNLNDEKFEKAEGKKGEEFHAGKEGYNKGVAAVKNNKGEAGYYNDEAAAKKKAEDEKAYYGGQNFNKEGKKTS